MPKRARRGQTAKSVLASDDPDDDDGSYFSVDDGSSTRVVATILDHGG